MTERDLDKNPYSVDEARVAKFLFDLGAGGGDDPIGFILVSHAYMAAERNQLRDGSRRSSAGNVNEALVIAPIESVGAKGAMREAVANHASMFPAVPQTSSMTRPAAFLAWAADTFGPIALDRKERALRFLEEALEVAHAEGVEQMIADRLLGRTWNRNPDPADTPREIGQAYACLETYAESIGVSADVEATKEFKRVQTFPKEVLVERHKAKIVLGIALNTSTLPRPEGKP